MKNGLIKVLGLGVVFIAVGCGDKANTLGDRELVASIKINDDLVAAIGIAPEKNCVQRVKRTSQPGVEFVEVTNQACPKSGLAEEKAIVASFPLQQDTVTAAVTKIMGTQSKPETIGYLDYSPGFTPSLHYLCTSYYAKFCTAEVQNGVLVKIDMK